MFAKVAANNQTESRMVNGFSSLVGTEPPEPFSVPASFRTAIDESKREISTSRAISETSSLGDIMSSGLSTPVSDGVSGTNNTTTLADCYGIHHPLDRMALTANGNLQRLVASYYDAPVSVVVQSCTLDTESGAWDRVVHLQVAATTTFCIATSVIHVHDPVCQQLVESGRVGIGQLFRFLNVLPEFQLLTAGPRAGGGFWREYRLDCPELTCRIHEEFEPNMWEIELP